MAANPQASANVYQGVVLAVLGWGLITVNDSLVKSLAAELAVGQVIFLRGVFIALPVAWLVHRAGGLGSLRAVNAKGQLVRGLLLALSTFAFISSLRWLPLADAIALTLAAPLFVTGIAPWLLGEVVGWRRWAAVVIGFIGVLVMLRPGTEGFRWAALMPLAAAVSEAFRDVVTRRMVATETSVSLLAWSTAVVTLCALGTVTLGWAPVAAVHLGFLLAAACFMAFGHFLTVEAFRYAEAGIVSPFRYSNLVWAMLIGAIVFGDYPDPWMITGAVLVVSSGLYILRRESTR